MYAKYKIQVTKKLRNIHNSLLMRYNFIEESYLFQQRKLSTAFNTLSLTRIHQ